MSLQHSFYVQNQRVSLASVSPSMKQQQCVFAVYTFYFVHSSYQAENENSSSKSFRGNYMVMMCRPTKLNFILINGKTMVLVSTFLSNIRKKLLEFISLRGNIHVTRFQRILFFSLLLSLSFSLYVVNVRLFASLM